MKSSSKQELAKRSLIYTKIKTVNKPKTKLAIWEFTTIEDDFMTTTELMLPVETNELSPDVIVDENEA